MTPQNGISLIMRSPDHNTHPCNPDGSPWGRGRILIPSAVLYLTHHSDMSSVASLVGNNLAKSLWFAMMNPVLAHTMRTCDYPVAMLPMNLPIRS